MHKGFPKDLLTGAARSMIIVTWLFFTICAVIISGSASTGMMARLLGISVLLGLVSYLAHRFLERSYLASQLLWQVSLVIIILSVVFILNLPEILLIAALLPLIAVITLGWPAGLAAEIVVIAMVQWVTGHPAGYLFSPRLGLIIMIFGGFSGVLAWAATSYLLTLADWSLYNFEQARKNLDEAREQRVELKQTQEDLSKANQELARLADRMKVLSRVAEEARQAKAEFVANVSHELRTPLNMIIGFTEVIARSPRTYGSRLPAALMTDITAIQRNSHHLLNLVNDVLDLSQVEAGRMALSCGWSDPGKIIGEAVEVVHDFFQSKGLYLRIDLAENLPEIFCDHVRIRQVLINLLSNAGRFTQQGGVQVTARLEGEHVRLSVTDTGPGVAPEDQKKIFEPFQQADGSIRRHYGGSGLGLTISKQFVEMHGGNMWLESQPGVGTTFTFTLPVIKTTGDEQETAGFRRAFLPGDEVGYRLRTRPNKAQAPVLTPRLVVLEKEQSLQRLLYRYLPDTEIEPVQSLTEAIEALHRSPAQALLINSAPFDEPPVKDFSNMPYGTPVISCWIPGAVEAAKELDVVQYLVKPLPREKLLETLDSLPGVVKTVLVADDEPDELHLFARMLESAERDYQVLQVTNGKRALSMLRSRRPDVLLLDLMMPVMDGFQVLQEKQNDAAIRDIPVIVISSRDPMGEMIVSNTLKVIHTSGYSARNLLEFIRTVSSILTSKSS